jgi:hypothetical protein
VLLEPGPTGASTCPIAPAQGHFLRPWPPGPFALYVAGYSGYRIFEETLRIDSSAHVLGLRLNFFVAAVLTLAGIIWFIVSQRRTAGAQPALDGEPVPGRVPGSR